ncbi:MAG: ATP-binding protein [Bacteroidales bacterium]
MDVLRLKEVTNKAKMDYRRLLNARLLATALLDRLLFKCQVISLEGKSDRLINRKSIFDQENL